MDTTSLPQSSSHTSGLIVVLLPTFSEALEQAASLQSQPLSECRLPFLLLCFFLISAYMLPLPGSPQPLPIYR